MSAFAIIALLGFAVLLPVFTNSGIDAPDDTDPDDIDPVDPDPPQEPENAVQGTTGPDSLQGQTGQTVNGGAGQDTLSVGENAAGVTLNGGAGNDTFALGGDDNSVNTTANGDGGNDTITAGINHLDFTTDGGAGNDSIIVSSDGESAISGGAGDDTIRFDGEGGTVAGGAGNDILDITSGGAGDSAVTVTGGPGDDFIGVGRDNLTAEGGEGNDRLQRSFSSSGTYENSVLNGGAGNDLIEATGDNGILGGGDGEDTLSGGRTDEGNLLDGGDGNDLLQSDQFLRGDGAAVQSDTLSGGAGSDSFEIGIEILDENPDPGTPLAILTDFDPAVDAVRLEVGGRLGSPEFQDVTLTENALTNSTDALLRFADPAGSAPDTFALIRFEGVTGLSAEDLDIDDGRVLLEGTEGNDTLSSTGNDLGRFGLDTLSGLAGDDLLVHIGADETAPLVLNGGDGNDTLSVDEVEFGTNSTLDGGAGDDVFVTRPFTTGSSGDSFTLGSGADEIEIGAFFTSSPDDPAVFIGTVTDFTPGEDIIVIDTSGLAQNEGTVFRQDVTLTEDTADNSTLLRYVVSNDTDTSVLSGSIRLEGLSGLTGDDIGLTLTDAARPPTQIAIS